MFLNRFSRVHLAELPTPLQYAERLSAELGNRHIWLKRDDITGLGMGGNKLRKLEFIMADALETGADTVITTGGIQSNHARLTAAAASKLGLNALLVLGGDEPELYQGNLLLDRLLGAELRFVPVEPGRIPDEEVAQAMYRAEEELREAGRKPYVIPLGGSVPLGVLGYIGCMMETAQQSWRDRIQFDHVFVASGSGGTVAGIALGLWIVGTRATHVHAVSVGPPAAELGSTIDELIVETAEMLQLDPAGIEDIVTVHDDFIGDGYGALTPGARRAMELLGQTEGIILDSVYTAKAADAMVELCESELIDKDDTVLFIHTGGSGGLFAKAELLDDQR